MASIKDDAGKEIETYTIPADVVYNVLQYLASKPYIEVHTHIQGLQLNAVANYVVVQDSRTVTDDNA